MFTGKCPFILFVLINVQRVNFIHQWWSLDEFSDWRLVTHFVFYCNNFYYNNFINDFQLNDIGNVRSFRQPGRFCFDTITITAIQYTLLLCEIYQF